MVKKQLIRKNFYFCLLALIFCSAFPLVSKAEVEDVLINEIYYDTVGDDRKEEFIELYNPTDRTVDLTGYYLEDDRGRYDIDSVDLAAKSFLVLARDQAGFKDLFGFRPDYGDLCLSLKNDGDLLKLFGRSGRLIDQISWELGESSHPGVLTGQSLERSLAGSKDIIANSRPSPGLGLFFPAEITDVFVDRATATINFIWPAADKSNFERLTLYLKKTKMIGNC